MSRQTKQEGYLCGPTRKRRFKSHDQAMSRAAEILAGPDCERGKSFGAYLCHYCAGWHLTSR